MTTRHSPESPDDHDRPPADPFRPDAFRCDCGAIAGRDGRCRKCRARAAWTRRSAGRRPHADRPPTRRERARRTGR